MPLFLLSMHKQCYVKLSAYTVGKIILVEPECPDELVKKSPKM
jgi:hypothetical protein